MNEGSIYTEDEEAMLQRLETTLSAGYSLDRFVAETGIHERDLTKALSRSDFGYSYTDINNRKKTLITIKEWFELKESKNSIGLKKIANTKTFEKLSFIIETAHEEHDFVAITGDVGIGKSVAAIEHVKANPRGHNKSGAVRVEFTRAENKDTAALHAILSALVGQSEVGKSAYRNSNMLNAICRELNQDDCLILDECNYLGASINIARDIYDKSGVAIILIGNPELSSSVWSKKDQAYAALASRVTRVNFPMTTAEDVEAYLDSMEIVGAKIRKRAIEIGARPGQSGGLRTLSKIISMHKKFYSGLELNAETFEQIAHSMSRLD